MSFIEFLRDRNNKAAILVIVAVITSIVLIIFVDSKASESTHKDYSKKNPEQEKNMRESIPVEYKQFVELVELYKSKNAVEMQGMGSPKFNYKDSLTTIDISNLEESGRSLLTGTQMSEKQWCSDTLCSFRTTQRSNGDVVVDCPADLLIRLVENKERGQ